LIEIVQYSLKHRHFCLHRLVSIVTSGRPYWWRFQKSRRHAPLDL
jgi:hypothetical protein